MVMEMMPSTAVDLQTESLGRTVPRPMGGEIAHGGALESISGMDFVARQKPDSFRPLPYLPALDPTAVFVDPAETPLGVAAKRTHQIHDVGAQHHQVLASSPSIFLAAAPQFEHVADRSLPDEFFDSLQTRAVAGLMGNNVFNMSSLAGSNHLVGFSEGTGHRFFQENVTSELGTGQHHVKVDIQPARGHTHDLRALFLEHHR